MSFTTPWINSYNSVMTVAQDPTTGMLKGTYASTTGGSGTYDVIGWASLKDATPKLGQTMAISILWRSNDGGHSDPSHEVSAMAGQVVATSTGENLVLVHIFVETNPATTPQIGFYPDKLIFAPFKSETPPASPQANIPSNTAQIAELRKSLAGIWTGAVAGESVDICFILPYTGGIQLEGTITYADGSAYPLAGFTDIFAQSAGFNWQGLSFSTYIDDTNGRKCIAMAGHLDLSTGEITLMKMQAQSTAPGETWYQVQSEQCLLVKK